MNKKEMTKIIGFQSGHDVSYCILENGVPIIHEELERFTREKEPLGDGLKFFFEQNPNMKDIDFFTFGNPTGRSGKWKERCGEQTSEDMMMEIIDESDDKNFLEVGHHQSHAANAFFSSNFDDALIVTLDGGGHEKNLVATAFTVWVGKNNKLHEIKIFSEHEVNIGIFWTRCTDRIFGLSTGPPYGSQAGTVMGMACLGEPKYSETFYNSLKNTKGLDYGYYKKLADSNEQNRFDIAASLQTATEKFTKEIMIPFVKKYNMKKLCLSGGVALNSVMIGQMYKWFEGIVDEIYIDPVPYDGGLSLGSARYMWHHVLDNPRIKWEDNSSSYLGRTYDEKNIKNEIDKFSDKLKSKVVNDDYVADLLTKDNNVISVFGGGSESGRRALGNRSILADPRSPDMKDIINEKVKHRQWFRPFAPSIIREEVKNWFEMDIDSPYMTTVLNFKEEVKDKVPAVVHHDGSGRLQTVTKNDNEWYYGLIKKFQEKTGVPILLNTSFNDREPIVETPFHAINCFLRTNIDYLYFYDANILVKKNKLF